MRKSFVNVDLVYVAYSDVSRLYCDLPVVKGGSK